MPNNPFKSSDLFKPKNAYALKLLAKQSLQLNQSMVNRAISTIHNQDALITQASPDNPVNQNLVNQGPDQAPKAKPLTVAEKLAKAKAFLASQQAALAAQPASLTSLPSQDLPNPATLIKTPEHIRLDKTSITYADLNSQQRKAIDLACDGGNLLVTGSAGTGKTTTQRVLIERLADSGKLKLLPNNWNHRYIPRGGYSVAIVSFITRAVNNIRDLLPEAYKPNACNIHQFLEFAPTIEEYETLDEDGNLVTATRKIFEPRRNALNPIIGLTTIIVEESSTVSSQLFNLLLDALPDRGADIQFIFLGDICQLKPVMGQSILAEYGTKWLADNRVVELTEIYRQALDSPIKRLAIELNANNPPSDKELSTDYVTPEVFQAVNLAQGGLKQPHVLAPKIANSLCTELLNGNFVPFRDIILVPFRKGKDLPWLCSDYFNKQLAEAHGIQRNATVYEVIAGFVSHYLAAGDPILLDKEEYYIEGIRTNAAYKGIKLPKAPSPDLSRTGNYRTVGTSVGIDLNSFTALETQIAQQVEHALNTSIAKEDDEDSASRAASHILSLRNVQTNELVEVSSSGEVNKISFAYAISIHKSIGSEFERVYLILHNSHNVMLTRELVYTAVTRAKNYLCMFYDGTFGGTLSNLQRAAANPWIKGTNLTDKLNWLISEELRKSENTTNLLDKFKAK